MNKGCLIRLSVLSVIVLGVNDLNAKAPEFTIPKAPKGGTRPRVVAPTAPAPKGEEEGAGRRNGGTNAPHSGARPSVGGDTTPVKGTADGQTTPKAGGFDLSGVDGEAKASRSQVETAVRSAYGIAKGSDGLVNTVVDNIIKASGDLTLSEATALATALKQIQDTSGVPLTAERIQAEVDMLFKGQDRLGKNEVDTLTTIRAEIDKSFAVDPMTAEVVALKPGADADAVRGAYDKFKAKLDIAYKAGIAKLESNIKSLRAEVAKMGSGEAKDLKAKQLASMEDELKNAPADFAKDWELISTKLQGLEGKISAQDLADLRRAAEDIYGDVHEASASYCRAGCPCG